MPFITDFVPALTGQTSSSPEVRKLSSLPTRLGGLNIVNPVEMLEWQFKASQTMSVPAKKMIVEQSEQFAKPQLQPIKSNLRRDKSQAIAAKVDQLKQELSDSFQRAMNLGSEKGASIWLTTLPLQERGFNLNKQEFQDILCLRYIYGCQLKNLPTHCDCGSSCPIHHAMISWRPNDNQTQ